MRHRTSFPSTLNFEGWWIKSKKGFVAQLLRCGRNIRTENLYNLAYNDHWVGEGGGVWTTEELRGKGCIIRRTKEELYNENEPKTDPRPAMHVKRQVRRILRG